MFYFLALCTLMLAVVSTGLVSTQSYLLVAGVFFIIAILGNIKEILEDKNS